MEFQVFFSSLKESKLYSWQCGPLKNWLKFETSFWCLSFEIMNWPYVLFIQFCLYFICIQAIDKRVLNGKPITEMDFGENSFNKTSLNQFGQIHFLMSFTQFGQVGITMQIYLQMINGVSWYLCMNWMMIAFFVRAQSFLHILWLLQVMYWSIVYISTDILVSLWHNQALNSSVLHACNFIFCLYSPQWGQAG